MAEVVMVTITQGKQKYGADHEVGLLVTENLEFALALQGLLETSPDGYRAKIKRLPTHE
jgi:hypothetical protein